MVQTPFSQTGMQTGIWKGRGGEVTRMPVMAARRGGATAWSLPFAAKPLRQPQDGAVDPRMHLASISSHLRGEFFNEPDDARLTGGTRSLTRRLMGLNVLASWRKPSGERTKRSQVA